MSLQSLLGQDTIRIVRPLEQIKDADGAVDVPSALSQNVIYDSVTARVNSLSTQQTMMWNQLGIDATYEVQTQQGGVRDGDFILTSDGLILRVTGYRMRRKIGGLPGYYLYPCTEVKPLGN